MSDAFVNLGCGSVFIDSPEWINLDFAPLSSSVRQANLLGRLPLESGETSFVYSSHFFEHIPRSQVPTFLMECFRIMKPGAVIRLVLPDLENMARAYLKHRDQGEHKKADFLVTEIIDQCVRTVPGGEMGALFRDMSSQEHLEPLELELKQFVYERVGEVIGTKETEQRRGSEQPFTLKVRAALNFLRKLILRVWLYPLPAAFKRQNVSFAEVGEKHQWVWDFYQLGGALKKAGFINVARMSASMSAVEDIPVSILDLHPNGEPRKGAGSMYAEARKPEMM